MRDKNNWGWIRGDKIMNENKCLKESELYEKIISIVKKFKSDGYVIFPDCYVKYISSYLPDDVFYFRIIVSSGDTYMCCLDECKIKIKWS